MKNHRRYSKLLVAVGLLFALHGCGSRKDFSAWLQQFETTEGEGIRIWLKDARCSDHAGTGPSFMIEYADYLSFLPRDYDTAFYRVWPVARFTLPGGAHATVTGACDLRYEEAPPHCWLSLFGPEGDTVHNELLTPFLWEEAFPLFLEVGAERSDMYYQDVAARHFIRLTADFSGGTRVTVRRDTVPEAEFRRLYPREDLFQWLDGPQASVPSFGEVETVYEAECDLDGDGRHERLRILDPHLTRPDNSGYERFYVLRIGKKDGTGAWTDWMVNSKAIPASDETFMSTFGFACGAGSFSFRHHVAGTTETYIFRFDSTALNGERGKLSGKKALVLVEMRMDMEGNTPDTVRWPKLDRVPLRKFDYLDRE